MNGVPHNPLNGRLTTTAFTRRLRGGQCDCSYEDAMPQEDSNLWSVTENNRNNARNVNFNNGNANNNNKYNGNVVRPVAAYGNYAPADFIRSVWEAYHDCVCGKMRSSQCIDYLSIAVEDIPHLANELWTGSYKPGTSTCFLVKYPKWREVFAASFRDRIIHHWICLRLEPLFEERFVAQGNVSFNCRKGYGTERAVEHVSNVMRYVSGNYKKPAWVFKGDLVGFFMSIDKELLWYLIERFARRRYHGTYKDVLMRVTKAVVMHHPEDDCVLNSPETWWQNLEPNKSLFTSPTGEPIGNLTTQLFANFLMSFFVARVQWLFRGSNWGMAQFVDDFVIVCDDLGLLKQNIGKIEKFLKEKLRLTLHKDKRYLQPVGHGVLFVGTYIKPGRLYLSNRTLARMEERCEGFRRLLEEKELSLLDVQRMEQVLNSYFGFCKRRETYNFRRKCIERLGARFWDYFYVEGRYERVRAKKRMRKIDFKQ